MEKIKEKDHGGMFMIKLIASDMDGTLLDSYRNITKENADAIHMAQEAGIEFIINTGREYPSVKEMLKEANVTCGAICCNGSTSYDEKGNLLQMHEIPKDTLKKIFALFKESSLIPTVFIEEGRGSVLKEEERRKYVIETMIPAMQINHPDYIYGEKDVEELVHDSIYVGTMDELAEGHRKVIKLFTQSLHPEELKDMRKKLEEVPGLAVVQTVATDLEITADTAQKGIALMDYAKLKGYQVDEILAVGDSENDYSMLSIPGLHSVAMENAADIVKDVCVYQTKANTKDGIAYIIRCILKDRENLNIE